MRWRVSAKERADAIEWLLGLADLELRGVRDPFADETSDTLTLAGEAFRDERLHAFNSFDTYLEAAALLRDGWRPGGES